jgi:hypothetical protein
MSKNCRKLSACCIILSVYIVGSSVILFQHSCKNTTTSAATDITKQNLNNKNVQVAAEPKELVNPEDLIIRDAKYEAGMAEFRMKLLELKNSGHTLWGSQNWMKDPNYYKSLNTFELVEDCFSRPIFAYEMTIHNDHRAGYESLRIFHNGFAELFSREDLWKGILHLYDYLSLKLNTQADLGQIVTTSGHLDAMAKLYGLSPFREQVKGKEGLFLAANMRVLKRFKWFLENYDPKKLGTEGSPGFFGEPSSVAQVALMLAKQVDSKRYAQIEPAITSIRRPKEQNVKDLKDYLDLVITSLDGFVTEQNAKQLDEILLEAAPRK